VRLSEEKFHKIHPDKPLILPLLFLLYQSLRIADFGLVDYGSHRGFICFASLSMVSLSLLATTSPAIEHYAQPLTNLENAANGVKV
jgi:hypothetical protein